MPAEDEFRKVAEDVRELARTLRSELRSAKWEAKEAARQARRDFRAARHGQGWQDPNRTGWYGGWGGSDWSQPGQWWSADQASGPDQNPGTGWGPTAAGGWTASAVGDAPVAGATDGTPGGWSGGPGPAGGTTSPGAGGPPAAANGAGGNGNVGPGGPAAGGSGGAGPSVGGRSWGGPGPGGGWTGPTGYAGPGYNPGRAAGPHAPPWSPQWGPGGRPPWARSRYRGPHGYGPPPAWSTGPAPPAVGTQVAPPPWPPTPPRAPRPPKPPKPSRKDLPPVRHRRDGSTLLSLLLVLVGLAWLVSTTGVLDVSLEAVVAVALVILGAAMVVTARTDWGLSRRSWPVWVGAILIVLLASSVNGRSIGARLSSLRFGPVNTTPVNWADANTTVSGFAGPVAVDLTELTPGTATGTETMHVRNTFGPITVTLPADPKFRIHIDARTSFGPVAVPGASGRGSGGVFTHEVADVGNGAATLNLNLSDGFGPVTINGGDGSLNLSPGPTAPSLPPVPGGPQSHEG